MHLKIKNLSKIELFGVNFVVRNKTLETSNSILILPRHHQPPDVAQSQHTTVSKTPRDEQ